MAEGLVVELVDGHAGAFVDGELLCEADLGCGPLDFGDQEVGMDPPLDRARSLGDQGAHPMLEWHLMGVQHGLGVLEEGLDGGVHLRFRLELGQAGRELD